MQHDCASPFVFTCGRHHPLHGEFSAVAVLSASIHGFKRILHRGRGPSPAIGNRFTRTAINVVQALELLKRSCTFTEHMVFGMQHCRACLLVWQPRSLPGADVKNKITFAPDDRNLPVSAQAAPGVRRLLVHGRTQRYTRPAPAMRCGELLVTVVPPTVTHPDPAVLASLPPRTYRTTCPIHLEARPVQIPVGAPEHVGACLICVLASC